MHIRVNSLYLIFTTHLDQVRIYSEVQMEIFSLFLLAPIAMILLLLLRAIIRTYRLKLPPGPSTLAVYAEILHMRGTLHLCLSIILLLAVKFAQLYSCNRPTSFLCPYTYNFLTGKIKFSTYY